MSITYNPIGVIHSPFKDLRGMPIQPASETSGPGGRGISHRRRLGSDGFAMCLPIISTGKSSRLSRPFLDSEPCILPRALTRPNPRFVARD
jgi:hypothetical protein